VVDPALDEFVRVAWKVTAWIVAVVILGALSV
jgi:hypothetical protein